MSMPNSPDIDAAWRSGTKRVQAEVWLAGCGQMVAQALGSLLTALATCTAAHSNQTCLECALSVHCRVPHHEGPCYSSGTGCRQQSNAVRAWELDFVVADELLDVVLPCRGDKSHLGDS